jgi:hypothetical protein
MEMLKKYNKILGFKRVFADRKKFIIQIYICILFTFIAMSNLEAGNYFGDDIEITVLPVLTGDSQHGYTEYPFEIKNYSKTKSHSVELFMPGEASHSFIGNYLSQLSKKINIPPNSTIKISLFQPFIKLPDSDVNVYLDSILQLEKIHLGFKRNCYNYTSYSVLHGKEVPTVFLNTFEKLFSPSSGYKKNTLNLSRIDFPLHGLSSNVLAYSRYDAILLTYDEFSILNKDQKNVMYKFVALGGNLGIIGQIPSGKIFDLKINDSCNIGFGKIYNFRKKLQIFEELTNTKKTSDKVYFISSNFIKQIKKTSSILSARDSITSLNSAFPVIDNISIPSKMIIVIMATFAIIAITLSIALGFIKNKSMLLYILLPCISMIFALILVVVSVINDGITPSVRTQSFTILDQGKKTAYTIAVSAYYTPISLRSGLHFDPDSEVFYLSNYNENMYTVNLTNDQNFLNAWITPRTPAFFGIRKYQKKRERIIFRKNNTGEVRALNGFPLTIDKIFYSNEKGEIFEAENIQPGKIALLNPYNKNELKFKQQSININSFNYLNIIQGKSSDKNNGKLMLLQFLKYLHPSEYILSFKGSPFIENAISGSIENKSQAIVFGINLKQVHEVGEK